MDETCGGRGLMPEPNEKTHSSIKLFHMIKELESNYECQRENNNESISNINQMFLKHKDKIEALEKWNQNHLKFEHSAIADELLKQETEISELKGLVQALYTYDNTKVLMNKINKNREVLQEHLKSHIRVAKDQLTDKDRMTIFREFDKDIENQLKKFDDKDGEKEPTEKYNPYKAKSILLEPYEIVVKKADIEWLFNEIVPSDWNVGRNKKVKTLEKKYLTED